MLDFPNMTPEELQASMKDDLYKFMMENLRDKVREEHADAISDYLGSWEQHIGLIFSPLSDEEKRNRCSANVKLAPKTAWGWIWLQSMSKIEREAQPLEFTVVVDEAPH